MSRRAVDWSDAGDIPQPAPLCSNNLNILSSTSQHFLCCHFRQPCFSAWYQESRRSSAAERAGRGDGRTREVKLEFEEGSSPLSNLEGHAQSPTNQGLFRQLGHFVRSRRDDLVCLGPPATRDGAGARCASSRHECPISNQPPNPPQECAGGKDFRTHSDVPKGSAKLSARKKRSRIGEKDGEKEGEEEGERREVTEVGRERGRQGVGD